MTAPTFTTGPTTEQLHHYAGRHSLHEQAAGFYEKLGFKRSPTDPLHLYLLPADARRSLGK